MIKFANLIKACICAILFSSLIAALMLIAEM